MPRGLTPPAAGPDPQPEPAPPADPAPTVAVAPRNNFKPSPLYKGSRAAELRGRNPAFDYEYKSTDENHPRSLKATGQLAEHEIGSDVSGRAMVAPWEPVSKMTDPGVRAAELREDQGKNVDTAIRKGKQILCRLPHEEYVKYALVEAAANALMEQQIYSPERNGPSGATMTAIVSRDPEADTTEMLRTAGHQFSG